MFCGIHSGCKMYLIVHQFMRNTTLRNGEVLYCRRLKFLQKALRPVSLTKFSYHAIKNRTSFYEQWKSLHILNRHQFACPVVYYPSYRNIETNAPRESQNEVKLEPKLGLYQRLKKMYKEYWYVLVPVHLITSCFWFGSFYYLAASGIDIPALLEKFGAPENWIDNLEKSKAGNVVLAYTLYKVATPVRYTVTIGGTTLSINYLKKWGWIKPVPNKEQIKQMYKEQKGVLKDFKTSCQDKMQVTKTELLKTKNEVQRHYNEAKEEFHKTMSEARADVKSTVREAKEELKDFARNIKENTQRK